MHESMKCGRYFSGSNERITLQRISIQARRTEALPTNHPSILKQTLIQLLRPPRHALSLLALPSRPRARARPLHQLLNPPPHLPLERRVLRRPIRALPLLEQRDLLKKVVDIIVSGLGRILREGLLEVGEIGGDGFVEF